MKNNHLLATALLAALAMGAFSCASESGEPAAKPAKPAAKTAPAPAPPTVFFAVKPGGEIPALTSPGQDAPVGSTLYQGLCLKVSGQSDDAHYKSVQTLEGETGLWVDAGAIEESENCGHAFALRDELYQAIKPAWDAFAARYAENPDTLKVPASFTHWLEKRLPDPVTEDILCWDSNDEYIDGPSESMSRAEAVALLASYLEYAIPYIDPDKSAPTPEQMFYQTALIEPGREGAAFTVTFMTQGGDCIPSMTLRPRGETWDIVSIRRTCMTYCTVFGDY